MENQQEMIRKLINPEQNDSPDNIAAYYDLGPATRPHDHRICIDCQIPCKSVFISPPLLTQPRNRPDSDVSAEDASGWGDAGDGEDNSMRSSVATTVS